MRVLVGRFEVHIPHSRSLKEKRAVIRRLRGRIRERFEISCAEVGAQDLHQRGVIGISAVGADRDPLDALWNRLVDWVDANVDGELIDQDFEIIDLAEENGS